MRAITELSERMHRYTDEIMMRGWLPCDALAALVAADETAALCTRDVHMAIELCGSHTRCATHERSHAPVSRARTKAACL
jgi:hypothetical protein